MPDEVAHSLIAGVHSPALRGALHFFSLGEICNLCVVNLRWQEAACKSVATIGFDAAPSGFLLRALPMLHRRFRVSPGRLAIHLDSTYRPCDLWALEMRPHGALLRELMLLVVEGVTDELLGKALSGCAHLQSLRLADYDLVGEHVMHGNFLASVPPSLMLLQLQLFPSMRDEALQSAAMAAPGLCVVKLEGLDSLTNAGIRALAGLKRLRELHLIFTKLGVSPQVTEDALVTVLNGCPAGEEHLGLKTLDFSIRAGPPMVLEDGGLPFFSQALAGHRNLGRLSLSGVSGMADRGFTTLPKVCPELTELSLYRPGDGLTKDGLKSGVAQLKSLEQLSLGITTDFRSAFFDAALACSCRLLRLELTRYFRTAASADLLTVLDCLGRFQCLQIAVFRGTFSEEQVRGTMHASEGEHAAGNAVAWFVHDEQTFTAQLFPLHFKSDCTPIHVRFERCFPEITFR